MCSKPSEISRSHLKDTSRWWLEWFERNQSEGFGQCGELKNISTCNSTQMLVLYVLMRRSVQIFWIMLLVEHDMAPPEFPDPNFQVIAWIGPIAARCFTGCFIPASVKQRLKCLSCIYQGISDGMKRVAVKISRDDLSRRGWKRVGKSCWQICPGQVLFQNQPPVEYLPISCCQSVSPWFLSTPYQNNSKYIFPPKFAMFYMQSHLFPRDLMDNPISWIIPTNQLGLQCGSAKKWFLLLYKFTSLLWLSRYIYNNNYSYTPTKIYINSSHFQPTIGV